MGLSSGWSVYFTRQEGGGGSAWHWTHRPASGIFVSANLQKQSHKDESYRAMYRMRKSAQADFVVAEVVLVVIDTKITNKQGTGLGIMLAQMNVVARKRFTAFMCNVYI